MKINEEKYSLTTSRLQKSIKIEAEKNGLKVTMKPEAFFK